MVGIGEQFDEMGRGVGNGRLHPHPKILPLSHLCVFQSIQLRHRPKGESVRRAEQLCKRRFVLGDGQPVENATAVVVEDDEGGVG